MIERPSARLILLDPQDRLFLFNVHDPAVFDPAQPFFDPFWVMIGGMVDPGEDYVEAAVREAGERDEGRGQAAAPATHPAPGGGEETAPPDQQLRRTRRAR